MSRLLFFFVVGATLLPSTLASQVIVYNFDEASGPDVVDHSGNGHDGTLHGTRVPGRGGSGSAMSVPSNDSEDHVSVPASFLPEMGQQFYMEAWIKLNSEVPAQPNRGTLFLKRSHNNDVEMGLIWDESFLCNAFGGVANTATVHTSVTIPVGGDWTKVACWFDGVRMRAYVNGVQVADDHPLSPHRDGLPADPATFSLDWTTSLQFVALGNNNNNLLTGFPGDIDDYCLGHTPADCGETFDEDPYFQFSGCSEELGCSFLITPNVPKVQAASWAVTWCRAATDFTQGDYAKAAVTGTLALGDIALTKLQAPWGVNVSLSAAGDCAQILWESYYDDVINAGQEWGAEVQASLGLLMSQTPGLGLPDLSFLWGLWVGSPVGLEVSDASGNSLIIDVDGNVTLDPDLVAIAAGFGDQKKLVLVPQINDDGLDLSITGVGANPTSTFSLGAIETTYEVNSSLWFGEVPTDDGAEAFADLTNDPSALELQLDLDGNGTFEAVQPPDEIVQIHTIVFIDGFESGDTSLWSASTP